MEQFVLLNRAGELATDAGNADVACELVDAIVNAGFDLPRPLAVKVNMLSLIVAKLAVADGERMSKAAAAVASLAREAADNGKPDDAKDLLQAAQKKVEISRFSWPNTRRRF